MIMFQLLCYCDIVSLSNPLPKNILSSLELNEGFVIVEINHLEFNATLIKSNYLHSIVYLLRLSQNKYFIINLTT